MQLVRKICKWLTATIWILWSNFIIGKMRYFWWSNQIVKLSCCTKPFDQCKVTDTFIIIIENLSNSRRQVRHSLAFSITIGLSKIPAITDVTPTFIYLFISSFALIKLSKIVIIECVWVKFIGLFLISYLSY